MVLKKIFNRTAPEKAAPPKVSVPGDVRVYAIGDIHGCLSLLTDLLEKIEADLESHQDNKKPLLIFLGDYVDRGAHSKQTLSLLIDIQQNQAIPSIFLKGNHEDAMLQFLKGDSIAKQWLQFGGVATLQSYGIEDPGATHPDRFEVLRTQLQAKLSTQHLKFLQTLKLSYVVGDYLFVHAGINPVFPLHKQQPEDLMWIRGAFLDSTKSYGKIVVHGHTITQEPEIRPNRIGIDTGAYASGTLTALVLEDDQRRFIQS